MLKFYFSILFILSYIFSFSQPWKHSYNWYFGEKAALNFNTNPPSILNDNIAIEYEGSITFSDSNGNLLFYTDGKLGRPISLIYNRNHNIMKGGDSIYSHETSTQFGVVVPHPGHPNQFFLFTAIGGKRKEDAAYYHLIDMNKDNGFGEVISKNNRLVDTICEKITATPHSNGRDYWVAVHGFYNNIFHLYLVNERGVVECPINQSLGVINGTDDNNNYNITSAQGSMKFNRESNLLANGIYDLNFNSVDLFSFNSYSGTLNYIDSQLNIYYAPYSLEFLDEKKIVVSTRNNQVYFIDFEKDFNRFYLIYNPNNNLDNLICNFQMAPNGKVYGAYVDSNFLSEVKLQGDSAIFIEKAQSLGQNKSLFGLPSFSTDHILSRKVDIQFNRICGTDSLEYFPRIYEDGGILLTEIRDAQNSLVYQSQATYFKIKLDHGSYQLKIRWEKGSEIEEKTVPIEWIRPYEKTIWSDTILCNSESIAVDLGDHWCIKWSDGIKGRYRTLIEEGTYQYQILAWDQCYYDDSLVLKKINLETPIIEKWGDSQLYVQTLDSIIWDRDGEIESIENPMKLIRNGTYRARVKQGPCEEISEPILISGLTSLNNINEKIKIYPNPFEDYLVFEGIPLNSEYEIFDLFGKSIQKGLVSENINFIHLSQNLSTGLYLITFKGKDLYLNYKINKVK